MVTKINSLALCAIVWLTGCNMGTKSLVQSPNVQKIAGGFRFTEGPAVDASGVLYFTDIPNNKIYRWTEGEGAIQVLDNTGHGNGLYFSPEGDLLFCEMSTRRVMGMKPGGEVYILTDHYNGKKYNNPNDLWVHPSGGVYFTDPSYFLNEEEQEQSVEAVYYLSPGKNSVTRVTGHLVRPNGIIGSSDGRLLYVASDTIHKTWKFNILPDGGLSDRVLFVENGHDGLTLDELGNLYITNRDSLSVDIYNQEGEFLESIKIPEPPSNACFGKGNDRTLYVTARTSVYAVHMKVRGQ